MSRVRDFRSASPLRRRSSTGKREAPSRRQWRRGREVTGEEPSTKSARRDKWEGRIDRFAGRVLEFFGRLTGNRKAGAKGKAARVRGAARSAKARVKSVGR
jgi:uncharacterized protein YjbJ (UPF0337 family)